MSCMWDEKEIEKGFEIGKSILNNYTSLEESIVRQLCLSTPNHHLTTGTYREAVWESLFEMMIPHKFCISQGVFIIDSYGGVSYEVDLAIYDEMYTPYIFNYGKIKFIPIEAVAVVIQCKSCTIEKANLESWVNRIKNLKPSLDSVLRVISGLIDNNIVERDKEGYKKKVQTATRPIFILCRAHEQLGDKKAANIPAEITKLFDITLYADGTKLIKTISNENDWTYTQWYDELCHYNLERYEHEGIGAQHDIPLSEVKKQSLEVNRTLSELRVTDKENENVLMSLTFQLNQLLMILNNPMAFPHAAYAKRFSEIMEMYKNINKKDPEN